MQQFNHPENLIGSRLCYERVKMRVRNEVFITIIGINKALSKAA
jgi:hypothetical protein